MQNLDIKELRNIYRLTQQQLSDITGIPKRTIENWENGSRQPKDYIINLINEFLKMKQGTK
jgi:DNA-binding transcriptional regulator YiaG